MLSIAFGQSKYYVDNLSENIKRGIRQKLRNGIWPAWAPLGYVNDKNARCIAVDKEKAKYIKRAFEMYSTGEYPLAQIRKIINSIGLVGKKGKMLSVSNYQYMLKNKIYYGMIEYNGEIYDGKHFAFLKDANQAEKYAQQENPERIRDFLKKIGSNFRIADRTLACDFKNAFKIAEKYHAEALCAEATSFNFAECKTWRRGWDSNPRNLAAQRFSRPSH